MVTFERDGPTLPAFEELPLRRPGPPFNAWDLFGRDDELGRLNLITPECIKRGRDEIKEGIVVNLKYVRSIRGQAFTQSHASFSLTLS